MKTKWNYGDAYKRHNMTGIITAGTGELIVHNIFDELPEFMKKADCIFCDPPCSLGNINTFYTKAERTDYQVSYEPFQKRLFEVIDAINPKRVFIEVFKSNREQFKAEIAKRFPFMTEYESMYYNKPGNKCWIIHGDTTDCEFEFDGMDEEKIIENICKNVDFDCIADPCMGRGLVAMYATRYSRKFVGTELNAKRLAVAVERAEAEL